MSAPMIKFDDGAVYERMMGKWSGLIGRAIIDWLSPPPDLRWVDIGCGNGAFTQLLVQHCAPMTVEGVVLDGYEAIRQIKSDASIAKTPVIAVSSFAMKGDEEKARAAGCDAYVTKPYSPMKLLALMKTFLEKTKT